MGAWRQIPGDVDHLKHGLAQTTTGDRMKLYSQHQPCCPADAEAKNVHVWCGVSLICNGTNLMSLIKSCCLKSFKKNKKTHTNKVASINIFSLERIHLAFCPPIGPLDLSAAVCDAKPCRCLFKQLLSCSWQTAKTRRQRVGFFFGGGGLFRNCIRWAADTERHELTWLNGSSLLFSCDSKDTLRLAYRNPALRRLACFRTVTHHGRFYPPGTLIATFHVKEC